jgi:hypothetical protein
MVCTVTAGMVWRSGVFSDTGVAVMGQSGSPRCTLGGQGIQTSPLAPEVAPSSLEDSLRAVCKDSDPLCTIPTNTALESHS